MGIYVIGDRKPTIADDCWVAPNAVLVGEVNLLAGASVWFGAVVRADNEPIIIGTGSNVQDNAVLHVDPGCPLTIGKRVTIGHQVMLHGCTIGDGSLIGIQAVVLNRARIGRRCLVGAGALVTEGKTFPDGMLIIGSPAKVARELTAEEIAGLDAPAESYRQRSLQFAKELRPWIR